MARRDLSERRRDRWIDQDRAFYDERRKAKLAKLKDKTRVHGARPGFASFSVGPSTVTYMASVTTSWTRTGISIIVRA